MFAPAQFRPIARGAFLPQVRLSGAPQQQQGMRHGQLPFLGTIQLGQTAEDWYKRARAALERYRFLKDQIQSINNDVGRNTIITWLGNPSLTGSPEFSYARVLHNFTVDASPSAEGIEAYASGQRQNRVERLEGVNDQFLQKIEASRVTYGTRPIPTTPGAPTGGQQPPSKGPDLTVPILVAGAAIAAAVIFG